MALAEVSRVLSQLVQSSGPRCSPASLMLENCFCLLLLEVDSKWLLMPSFSCTHWLVQWVVKLRYQRACQALASRSLRGREELDKLDQMHSMPSPRDLNYTRIPLIRHPSPLIQVVSGRRDLPIFLRLQETRNCFSNRPAEQPSWTTIPRRKKWTL